MSDTSDTAGGAGASETMATELATSDNITSSASRLDEIWQRHLDRYRRIDDLEKRVDEHAVRLRRRVTNLLESNTSTHRQSHLRLFVSHQCRPSADSELGESTSVANPVAPSTTTSNGKKWLLVIEGKLLIGHLDHASAAEFDARLEREFRQRFPHVQETHSSIMQATSKTTSTSVVPTEEEDPVQPVLFTHLFDKVAVQFQTVYQPGTSYGATKAESVATPVPAKIDTSAGGSSGKKKSRSAKRQKTAETSAAAAIDETLVDPRTLTYSEITELVWNKTTTTITNAGASSRVITTTTTPDAHAFNLHYDSPPPPKDEESRSIHGAIATVQLYPSRGPEVRYKPSKELAKAFFPKHLDVAPPIAILGSQGTGAKDDDNGGNSSDEDSKTPKKRKAQQLHNVTPLENEIQVPTSLTMKEITHSLFTYATDKQLLDSEDPATIQNDKTLKQLFQCDTMHFSDLQQMLLTNKLVTLLPKPAPVTLRYFLKDVETTADTEEVHEHAAPMTMDLHNDVYVPSLFPYRARECLRRVKRRELEYASCRTKGRYYVMASRAKDEARVKAAIEDGVSGTTLPQWAVAASLARAAPPHSEARRELHTDAKISVMIGTHVTQAQQAALQAWALVDACRNLYHETLQGQQDEQVAVEEQEKQQEEAGQGESHVDAMEIDPPLTAGATQPQSQQQSILGDEPMETKI